MLKYKTKKSIRKTSVLSKLARMEMEKRKDREFCPKCRKSVKTCYCDFIVPFDAGITFIFVIHPKEYRNAQGTGRMANLSLKKSILIRDIDCSNNEYVNSLIEDEGNFCVVLYPGKKSIKLNGLAKRDLLKIFPEDKRLVVFIIDGTWSSARKMMKLSANLQGLPRVYFDPLEKSKYKIRVQPDSVCLSTIESVYQLINIFSSKKFIKVKPKGAEKNLLRVFQKMIDDQLMFKLDPKTRGYRKKGPGRPKVVRPAKKWLKRSLFYNK